MYRKRPFIAIAIGLAAVMAGCALVTQPLVKPIGSTPARVDAVALERHLRVLAEKFHPRSHDRMRNTGLAARYIREFAQFRGV